MTRLKRHYAVLWLTILISLISGASLKPIIDSPSESSTPSSDTPDISTSPILSSTTTITNEQKPTAHLKTVRVTGIRLESNDAKVLLGHNKKHLAVVQPEKRVKAVVFGMNFQDVGAVTFTTNGLCDDLEQLIEADFTSLTSSRLVFEYSFPESVDTINIFKLCIAEKFFDKPTFVPLEDPFTSVTTEVPVPDGLLPNWALWVCFWILLGFSGLFSGLNLGLMTLSPYELQLYIAAGTEQEKKYASKILPIRKKGNQLLCTLLIGNVIVNVAVSMLTDTILGTGAIVLVTATSGIVLFGEIIPQALCVKLGLPIGYHTIPITQVLLFLMWPVTWPIAKVLDIFLKEELTRSLERNKLVEMLKLSEKSMIGGQTDEFKMVLGALELHDKTVENSMTKFDDIFMLPSDLKLTAPCVSNILSMGYTRIPIYENEKTNVVGLLFIKDLALLDPDEEMLITKVASIYNHEVRRVLIDMPLRSMLEEFKKGEYHMALVEKLVEQEDRDPIYELCGLITLEDIIEEIIQCEIIDETDAVMDNVNRKKRQRKRNNDMSQIVNTPHAKCVVNISLLAVTIHVVSSCHKILSNAFIDNSILQKLIRQNCQKVETTQFSFLKEIGVIEPRPAILYTRGEPSDKFIMILSGRVVVNIGKENMLLEAQPWHYFGTEILDSLLEAIENPTSKSSLSLNTEGNSKINFTPDFDAKIEYECVFVILSVADILHAYNSTQILRSSKSPVVRTDSRISLIEEIPTSSSTPIRALTNSKPRTVSEGEKVHLLPDESVRFKREEE